jgi:hypothetical protein
MNMRELGSLLAVASGLITVPLLVLPMINSWGLVLVAS